MTIDTTTMKDELRYARNIFRELEKAGLSEGDTFDYTDLDNRSYFNDPTTVASWVNLGITKLDTKVLVKRKYGRDEMVLTPEQFVDAIAEGKNLGSFHTRNRYEVVTTDYKQFKEMYINKIESILDAIIDECKRM